MPHALLRAYRVVWSVVTAAVYLFGVACSVWLLGTGRGADAGGRHRRSRRRDVLAGGARAGARAAPVRWSTLLRVLLGAAGFSLGLVGLGQLAGGAASALLLLVLASPDMPPSSARLLPTHRTPRHASDATSARPPSSSARPGGPASRRSAVAGDPERMAVLSGLRRDYLDELERRDPDGFDLWLALHAHPGEDPRPHLSLGGGTGPVG